MPSRESIISLLPTRVQDFLKTTSTTYEGSYSPVTIPKAPEGTPQISRIVTSPVAEGSYSPVTIPKAPEGTPQISRIVTSPTTYEPLTYQNIYTNYDTNITTTHENIAYIESLPPGTIVNDEGLTREQALIRLQEQEKNLTTDYETIKNYEQQGYTVEYDPRTGSYIFNKKQTTMVEPAEFDYKSWWMQREKELGGIASTAKAISAGFLNIFDPGYWGAIIGGRGGEYIYKQEYSDWKRIQEGKGLDVWINRQIPAYENVILPFIAAAGFGAALSAVSKIGTGAIKLTGVGAKGVTTVARGFSKAAPVVLGGSYAVMTGANIGKSFAYEQHKMVEPGTGISSIIRTGMQLGSGYAGYKWATGFKPVIGEFREGDIVYLRKYLTTFNGKPVIGYGKPVYLTKSGTFGKIIGPIPSNLKNVEWDVSKVFLEKTPVYSSPPSWEPDVGVTPSSIYNIKPISEVSIVPVSWMGKTNIMTGLDIGWQGKPIQNKLIIRPSSELMEPYKPFQIKYVEWQPKTGIIKHPGEIKKIDELFKLYRENKITIDEYQHYRDNIKNIVEDVKPRHPLAKPVFKPKPVGYNVKPIKMEIDKSGLISSEWYGKKYLETGQGWQGKPSKGWLSTKVYPKPVVRHAYETHFLFIVFEPPPVVNIKTKIFDFKPVKKTAKDIIISDKDITKSFGKTRQTQKTGTVTIQETKTITEQIIKPVVETEKDVITSPLNKNIIVPEELLKPVYTRKTEQLTDLLKDKRFQEYEISKIINQDESVKLLTGLFPIQLRRTESARISAQGQTQGLKQSVGVVEASMIFSISAYEQDIVFDKDFIRKPVKTYDYEYFEQPPPVTEKFTPVTIIPPFQFKKTPPPPVDISDEITNKIQQGQTVYHVLLRRQQFKNGKRINNKEYHRVTRKPLNYMDALAFAADKVDNTAKASFKLEKTIGKPGKIRKTIKPWENIMIEYNNKGDDRFVELPHFRIDSPGEIREISMKGWNTPKRRNKRRRIK